MEHNMTEGESFPQILRFALPILFGNLFQQLYNLADTIIVGRTLGIHGLASVGASSSLIFLIIGFCNGCCSGFAIPVAQSFGAGKMKEMRQYVLHAILLAVVTALVMTSVTALGCMKILGWIRTPENILQDAWKYLVILFLGIPCTMLYNMAAGILRALGDSKSPFLFLIISTIVNVIGDFALILLLGMGVAGAAVATVLAQGLSGILCILYMKRNFAILRFQKGDFKIDAEKTGLVMRMGYPMGLQSSITAIGSVMMQSAVNTLGSAVVAAFTAGQKVKMFFMTSFDAMGNTSATFCGQNMGAGKTDRIRTGIRQMIWIGLVYGVCAGLIMIFFGRSLVGLFVSREETQVIDYACLQMRALGTFYPVIAFLVVFRSGIQGIGHSSLAMFAGVCELAARGVMAVWVIPVYGFTAACFTDQTAWISATIFCTLTFRYLLRQTEKNSRRT